MPISITPAPIARLNGRDSVNLNVLPTTAVLRGYGNNFFYDMVGNEEFSADTVANLAIGGDAVVFAAVPGKYLILNQIIIQCVVATQIRVLNGANQLIAWSAAAMAVYTFNFHPTGLYCPDNANDLHIHNQTGSVSTVFWNAYGCHV